MSKEAIEALEVARAHILDAYRIWQADDVSAVPPPLSGAGAVIAKIDAVLSTLPIAVEGKALDEEQIAKLIWQHLPSKVAEEMTRDKHPPLFPQAEYTVATLSAKNFVEAIIDLVSPSSPGKDGGQEVEALKSAYFEGWRDAKSADRGETAEEEWLLSETFAGRPQPASTALVEKACAAMNDVLRYNSAFSHLPGEIVESLRRAAAALSASTSREGER